MHAYNVRLYCNKAGQVNAFYAEIFYQSPPYVKLDQILENHPYGCIWCLKYLMLKSQAL